MRRLYTTGVGELASRAMKGWRRGMRGAGVGEEERIESSSER